MRLKNFQVLDNLIEVKNTDQKKVWNADKIWTIPELLDQTGVQSNIFQQLAIINFISYLDPEFDKKQEETFFSKNKGERKKFLQSYIKKYQKRLEEYLQRFTLEGADIQLHWDIPDFISFKFINKPRAKESMLMRFPFLKSATFNVEPQLKPKENYLVTIIDFETLINSQLNVEYVMNVALTLQKFISNNIVGASLILKGRLPYGLLKWLRGESPLKPSPIPNVEILYAIPIKDDKEAKEYWFTLKVGTAYRLRKNNKSLVEAKDIHSKWDSIRSYTIIDHYITNVQQANYLLFIRDFWLAFDKIDKPEKDIPDFKILKSTSGVSDSEKKIKIKEKIESYKKSLTEEINDQKKPTHVREKCKGILDDINERKDDKLVNEIFQRVKFIADNVDNSVGLHYMNWNHIICDTVRKKNYNKQDNKDIQGVTPQFLDECNTRRWFQHNYCFIRYKESKKSKEITISASENPFRIDATIKPDKKDKLRRYFKFSLFNVIIFYAQLDRNTNFLEPNINAYLKGFLPKIPLEKFDFFYKFHGQYVKNKKNSDQLRPLEQEITNFFQAQDKPKFAQLVKLYKMRQHTSREAINLCRKISDSLLTREQKAQFDNYIKLYNAVRNDEIYEDFYQIEEMKITEFSMDIINKFFELLKCNLDDALAKIKGMKQGEAKFSEKMLDFKEDEKALVTILEETDLFNKLPGINLKNILSIMREHESQLVIAYPKNQLDDRMLLDELFKMIPKGYLYFYNNFYTVPNVVKLIYVVNKDGKIKVANEPLSGDRSSRPTHSELSNGFGVKAAGELIFHRQPNGIWELKVINNGSGHYLPSAHETLPFAKKAILKELSAEIIKNSVMVLNNLKPGMTLASGWNDDEDESFIALPPFVEAFNKSLQLQKPAATEFKSKQPLPKQVENESSFLSLPKKIHTVITSEGLQIDFFVSQKAMFAEQNVRRIEEKDILFEDRESYQYLADMNLCLQQKIDIIRKVEKPDQIFFSEGKIRINCLKMNIYIRGIEYRSMI